MAKSYTPVGWETGQLVKAPYVVIDGVEYEVHMPEYEGETPVTPDNLNHMDDAIKELYDEGTTSKDIVIGDESEITDDTKIFIDTSDEEVEIANTGSEVVNSLEGDEIDKSPSVHIVKAAIPKIHKTVITGTTSSSGNLATNIDSRTNQILCSYLSELLPTSDNYNQYNILAIPYRTNDGSNYNFMINLKDIFNKTISNLEVKVTVVYIEI